MSELIKSITEAYQNPENQAATTKSHRLFLSHTFYLPIRKTLSKDSEPEALYLSEGDQHFLPLFSSENLLNSWANNSIDEMNCLNILGKDVVLGSGQNTHICLDIGQSHYKEFAPSEISRLKQVTLKLERIAKATAEK